MPLRLLEQARAGEFKVAISTPIIEEIKRVLREKFGWPDFRLEQFERNLSQFTQRVEPTQKLDVVPSDPDDNRIVEAAVASGSEAIVTGDKDLLRLGSYQGVKMVRVRDFLQRGQGKD
jgi:putative PIN family toxin of toxin-antitoxin system